jgi:hypothetical protein
MLMADRFYLLSGQFTLPGLPLYTETLFCIPELCKGLSMKIPDQVLPPVPGAYHCHFLGVSFSYGCWHGSPFINGLKIGATR